jgi:hypothetical protein
MPDNRISCESCKRREVELEAQKQRASAVYNVGNPAKPGMGHAYYFTSEGRIALCIAQKR